MAMIAFVEMFIQVATVMFHELLKVLPLPQPTRRLQIDMTFYY
jgi:hypothetical protein